MKIIKLIQLFVLVKNDLNLLGFFFINLSYEYRY